MEKAMKTIKNVKKGTCRGASIIVNIVIVFILNGFICQAGWLGWILAILGTGMETYVIITDPEKADSFADLLEKAMKYFFGTLAWMVIASIIASLF